MTKLTLVNTLPNVDVQVNTTENLAAAEIHLSFDPQFIKINNFSPGSFFTNANVMDLNIDNTNGLALLTLLTSPTNTPTGQGTIATIDITHLKTGTTTINIDQKTKIAAIGKGENVLTETKDLTIDTTSSQTSPSEQVNLSVAIPEPTPSSQMQQNAGLTYKFLVISTAIILILIICLITLRHLFKK